MHRSAFQDIVARSTASFFVYEEPLTFYGNAMRHLLFSRDFLRISWLHCVPVDVGNVPGRRMRCAIKTNAYFEFRLLKFEGAIALRQFEVSSLGREVAPWGLGHTVTPRTAKPLLP